MFDKHSLSERVHLSNTLLQRGVLRWAETQNRFNFNGFYALSKTAETVSIPPPHSHTPLQQGVNKQPPVLYEPDRNREAR